MIFAGYDMLNQASIFSYDGQIMSIADDNHEAYKFLGSLQLTKTGSDFTTNYVEADGVEVHVVLENPWTHSIEYTPEIWDKLNDLVAE